MLKGAGMVLNLDRMAYAGKEPFSLVHARNMQERFAAARTAS